MLLKVKVSMWGVGMRMLGLGSKRNAQQDPIPMKQEVTPSPTDLDEKKSQNGENQQGPFALL